MVKARVWGQTQVRGMLQVPVNFNLHMGNLGLFHGAAGSLILSASCKVFHCLVCVPKLPECFERAHFATVTLLHFSQCPGVQHSSAAFAAHPCYKIS